MVHTFVHLIKTSSFAQTGANMAHARRKLAPPHFLCCICVSLGAYKAHRVKSVVSSCRGLLPWTLLLYTTTVLLLLLYTDDDCCAAGVLLLYCAVVLMLLLLLLLLLLFVQQ